MIGGSLQEILLLYCSASLTIIMLALLAAYKDSIKQRWSEVKATIASITGYADYEQTLDESVGGDSKAAEASAAAAVSRAVATPYGKPESPSSAQAEQVQQETPHNGMNTFATLQAASLPALLALSHAGILSPTELPPGRPLTAAAAAGTKTGDPDPEVLASYTSPQGILHSVPDLDLMSVAAAAAASSAKATAATAAVARGLVGLERAGSYTAVGHLQVKPQYPSPGVTSLANPVVLDDTDEVAAGHKPEGRELPQPPTAEATASRRSSSRERSHPAHETSPPRPAADSRLGAEDGEKEASMVTPARLTYGRIKASLAHQPTEDALMQMTPASPTDPEVLDSPRGVLHTTPPLDFTDAEIGGAGDGAYDDEDFAGAVEAESAGARDATAGLVQSARSRIPVLSPGGLSGLPAPSAKPWGDRKPLTPPTMKHIRWPKHSRELAPE